DLARLAVHGRGPAGVERVGEDEEPRGVAVDVHDDALGGIGRDLYAPVGRRLRITALRGRAGEQDDAMRIERIARERAERLLGLDDLGGRDPARAGKRLLVLVDPHAVDLGEQPDARPEHLGNPVEVTVDEDVARPGPVEERPDERWRQLPVEYPVPVAEVREGPA